MRDVKKICPYYILTPKIINSKVNKKKKIIQFCKFNWILENNFYWKRNFLEIKKKKTDLEKRKVNFNQLGRNCLEGVFSGLIDCHVSDLTDGYETR